MNIKSIYFKLLGILIMIFSASYIIYYNNSYNFCLECIKKSNNIISKCFQCSDEVLFQNLYIESDDNTLNEIIYHNKSIARYGDGEYNIIFGHNIIFQKYSKDLSQRLLEILNCEEKNLLIGIYYPIKKRKELDLYTNIEVSFWRRYSYYNKFNLFKIINQSKKFYSSGISRFYRKFKDKSGAPKYITKIKKIWEVEMLY